MGGLALTSCNDFLDRSPISDITPEDYFNTPRSWELIHHKRNIVQYAVS